MLGYSIVIPLLPYIGQRLKANALVIGLIFASYSFCQLISASFIGSLSDKYGRKKLLIISQLGTAAGFIVLFFSNSILLLLISRLIDGLTAGNVSLVQAVVLDTYDEKWRVKAFGYLGTATGVGIVVGPLISSLLSADSLQLPALAAFCFSIFTLVITIKFLKETRVKKEHHTSNSFSIKEYWKIISHKGIQKVSSIIFFYYVLLNGFLLTFPLLLLGLLHYDASQSGRTITLLFLIAVAFQLTVLQKILDNIKEVAASIMGMISFFIGIVLLFFAHNLAFILISGVFIMFAIILLGPLLNNMIGKFSDEYGEGKVMGLNQSIISLSQVIGPILGYAAYYLYSADGYIFLCAILSFITVFLVFKQRYESS